MTKEFSSTTGAALPADDSAGTSAPDQFAALPLHLIVTSLTNPRKTFNRARLDELVASITASGVHQPILVRPLPGSRMAETFDTGQRGMPRPTHEVVAGERRYRASIEAGLATIPAMIRHLTDAQVLEIQLVENLQRDDLTELEEAEGYERLMAHSQLTAEAVGSKIGKSRSYVYGRLKLLDLCQEAKQSLRDGAIDASRALLIARIPDGKLQIKAVTYASEAHSGEVPSVRLLQTWLRQNVMLPLDRAPFQIADARLIPTAGSCKDCPQRTGASPDLFADVVGADICTDPPCYNAKAEAHLARLQASADKQGLRLIAGPEAKTVCYEKSSTLNGYSPLSQVRADAGGQRLDALLEYDCRGAVLIENPWTHELIRAMPTAEAEGLLLAKGLVKALEKPAAKAGLLEAMIADLKQTTEREIEKEFRRQAYEKIALHIRAMPDAAASTLITPQLVRAWLMYLVDNIDAEMMFEVMQMDLPDEYLESQAEESIRLRVRAADAGTLFKALAFYMLQDDRPTPWVPGVQPTPILSAAAADKCIDLPSLRAEVTKQIMVETAEKIRELKAQLKPAKPPPPTTQPPASPAADAKTKKPAPLRKPKLSAQDAQSGIAEAMQGLEASAVAAEPAHVDQAVPVLKPGPQADQPFAIGQRVRVIDDITIQTRQRFAGKTGAITGYQEGEFDWTVTFKGRIGGVGVFAVGELDVVQP